MTNILSHGGRSFSAPSLLISEDIPYSVVPCSTSFAMQKRFNMNTELIFKIVTSGRGYFVRQVMF